MRRVVITGMGCVSPIGNTVEQVWKAVQEGTCGIGPITRYDTADRKVKLAGEIKNLDIDALLDARKSRKMDRYTQLAMIAANEAVSMADLQTDRENADRCGVILASGIGGLSTIEQEDERGHAAGFDRVSPYFIPMAISNMAAGQIAIAYGLKGMCSCVVTACASGTNAIGDAFHFIRDGYAEVMLAGGSESCITPLGMGGFTSMKALTTETDPARASIPFDKERKGFVMGEGAAVLVLEELEHARKRGAVIYGEVAGYGANCDAHHITAPLSDGAGAAACMKLAMQDAGCRPEEIGYLNAHGTSTPLNDRCETAAIHAAFGDWADSLAVSSTKSMTGHLLGASGAVEAVITTLAVKEGFLPPTIHYQVPDEDCDLDIVPNQGRNRELTAAMSDSLGFGGHNAALVFRKYKEE